MRAPIVLTILGALPLIGGCGGFFARRDVLRGNQAVYDGIRARDPAKLRDYVAADFRWDAPDGKPRNRDEWLAAVAATPGDIVSITGLRLTTEQRGDKVTVCGVQRAIVRVDGEEKIDDQPYCDDWQKRDGRWQIVEAYVPTF
ncbi:MAG TPA: nuclear transport factor 2 family protein [Polyangia bacterium]